VDCVKGIRPGGPERSGGPREPGGRSRALRATDQRGQQERRAGQIEARPGADRGGEDEGEQHRPDQSGQAAQAGDRPLQPPLRRGGHTAGHQALHRGTGQPPQRRQRNARPEQHAGGRQTIDHEAEGPEAEAGQERPPFAEPRDHRADQAALDDQGCHADGGEGQSGHRLVPAVPVGGVEHEGAGQHLVRQAVQQQDPGHGEQLRVGAQQCQRPQRIGLAPDDAGRAPVGGKGFRQDQDPVHPVRKAQSPRHPERQAGIHPAEDPAERRPQHEPHAEGGPQHPEAGGAPFGGRHIGDVGAGRRDAGRRDAGHGASDQEPAERWGQGHQDVVEPEAQVGGENHRPPAETVRKRPQQRREQELHERPEKAEQAVDFGRAPRVPAQETRHQPGEHRKNDAQRQDVQQHRDQDEHGGGAAHRPGRAAGRTGRGSGFGHGRITARKPEDRRNRCART